jgi:hypothetical protein
MEFSSHNLSLFTIKHSLPFNIRYINNNIRLSYLSMALGLAYYYISQRWASRVWLRELPSAMLVMTAIMMTR